MQPLEANARKLSSKESIPMSMSRIDIVLNTGHMWDILFSIVLLEYILVLRTPQEYGEKIQNETIGDDYF